MLSFTDQLGRTVQLDRTPQRIVSLVPSQTELLYHLGLEAEVAGITKFCVHPSTWFRTKPRVGGTKNVRLASVEELRPDLVIANKEENVKEQVEAIADNYPVWVSDVNTLEDAYAMMLQLGAITGTAAKAADLVATIQANFKQAASLPLSSQPLRTAYLIWRDPYMTVGGDTFIHHMLQRCALHNVFENSRRYPAISLHQLQTADCELLLLSSEPYPFKQQHIDALQQHLPHTKILLVDGELFSWYGSRLLHAPAYFNQLQQQIIAMD